MIRPQTGKTERLGAAITILALATLISTNTDVMSQTFTGYRPAPAISGALPALDKGAALLPAGITPDGIDSKLWGYLRAGLNYVEASGVAYRPDFVHPGGKAYGPLALTPIAIKDVIARRGEFKGCDVADILGDPIRYEAVARAYAELLLVHYLFIDRPGASPAEIFDILQRAWFLGPGLYKKGVSVPPSRTRNAELYIKRSAA
jgi:hypothetical protein